MCSAEPRNQQRFDLRLHSAVQQVSATRRGVRLELATPAGPQRVEAQVLLVAAGRTPNSDRIGAAAAGFSFAQSHRKDQ